MKRREFFAFSTVALAGCSSAPQSGHHVEFTQTGYEQALESGEPFMLDFFSPW